MRVLVAGATGAIGVRLMSLLTAAGHEGIGMARRGAAVAADALDGEAVREVVAQVAPDVIVNMLTAIPHELDPRRLARDFALTSRLRTEGTGHLVAAAKGARVISQGLAYGYDPADGIADEAAPLWQRPPKQFRPVLAALRSLEEQTLDAGGLVLRLGHLYGPGTIYAPDGSFTRQVREGKVPLVGGGSAVFSFSHTDDVASAVVAALDRPATGALNIVDDEPAPMSEWLPYFAERLGAPKPRAVPAALARLAVGGWGVAYMTRLRGADNARARLTLDWRPRHVSWREELGG